MKPGRRFLRLWVPVIVYMAAIFFSSSLHEPLVTPGPGRPLHAVAYCGLAVLVARALAGGWGRRITVRTAVAAVAISVAYGLTDEVHQMFVAGRSAEWRDVVDNTTGALAGTFVSWACGIILPASRDEL
jgi:VanZ family protein